MQGLASRTARSCRFHGEGGVREAAPYIVNDCKSIIRPGRTGKMMQK